MERVSPNQAAERVKKEDHITIAFKEGFEEFSETSKEFREEIFSPISWDESGNWGHEFKFEAHLLDERWDTANPIVRGAVDRIILAGEWDYIILHDQVHDTPGRLVLIWNDLKE